MSADDDEHSSQPSTSKMTENDEKIKNSSTKTINEQSMSPQTLFGSVTEFARRS
jgi:hypothetical protein